MRQIPLFSYTHSLSHTRTSGGTILRAGHLDIEALTLDREVCRIRDGLSIKYAECVYNGIYVMYIYIYI